MFGIDEPDILLRPWASLKQFSEELYAAFRRGSKAQPQTSPEEPKGKPQDGVLPAKKSDDYQQSPPTLRARPTPPANYAQQQAAGAPISYPDRGSPIQPFESPPLPPPTPPAFSPGQPIHQPAPRPQVTAPPDSPSRPPYKPPEIPDLESRPQAAIDESAPSAPLEYLPLAGENPTESGQGQAPHVSTPGVGRQDTTRRPFPDMHVPQGQSQASSTARTSSLSKPSSGENPADSGQVRPAAAGPKKRSEDPLHGWPPTKNPTPGEAFPTIGGDGNTTYMGQVTEFTSGGSHADSSSVVKVQLYSAGPLGSPDEIGPNGEPDGQITVGLLYFLGSDSIPAGYWISGIIPSTDETTYWAQVPVWN